MCSRSPRPAVRVQPRRGDLLAVQRLQRAGVVPVEVQRDAEHLVLQNLLHFCVLTVIRHVGLRLLTLFTVITENLGGWGDATRRHAARSATVHPNYPEHPTHQPEHPEDVWEDGFDCKPLPDFEAFRGWTKKESN